MVRAPAVGQTWHYAKLDYFSKSTVDLQVDQVAAVGQTVHIDSRSEPAGQPADRDASRHPWLHPFASARPQPEALPSEVQSPWGMVWVDPHWREVQVFESPIPLWPSLLQAGWHQRIATRYTTSDQGDGYPWELNMKADDWQTITVPAGTFRTLRYTNLINFRSSDPTRSDSVRRETIWFAPEIGRWAARESAGTYYVDDSAVDQPYNETSFRWELLAWT